MSCGLNKCYGPQERFFTCQKFEDATGMHGCGVGCNPCTAEVAAPVNGVNLAGGPRWLRPYNSRTADGTIKPLESDAQRVQRSATYQLGTCWDGGNGRRECFNQNQCGCGDAPPWCFGTDCADNPCDFSGEHCKQCGGSPACLCPDTARHCHHFGGYGAMSPMTQAFVCQACDNNCSPFVSPMTGTRHGERMLQRHESRTDSCTVNPLYLCIGRTNDIMCDPAEFWIDKPYFVDVHHQGGAGIWSEIDFTLSNDLGFQRHTSFEWDDRSDAIMAIKQSALDTIRSMQQRQRFGLDRVRRVFDGREGNDMLDYWSSGWSADTCDDLQLVVELPDSYLLDRGCKIKAAVYLREVVIELSLVIETRRELARDGNCKINDLPTENWPALRWRIAAETVIRIDGPGDCDPPPTILTDALCNQTVDRDSVILVDEHNREVVPPTTIEWWGGRSELTELPWRNIGDRLDGCDGNTWSAQCCSLTKLLEGYRAVGMPTVGTQPRIYDGTVTLDRFPLRGDCQCP